MFQFHLKIGFETALWWVTSLQHLIYAEERLSPQNSTLSGMLAEWIAFGMDSAEWIDSCHFKWINSYFVRIRFIFLSILNLHFYWGIVFVFQFLVFAIHSKKFHKAKCLVLFTWKNITIIFQLKMCFQMVAEIQRNICTFTLTALKWTYLGM